MALYDDYFTNEDKPFAENLNDALLLSNVFDMTVDVEAPKMFSNSTWVSTTSLRKCGVSILTLKEGLPSGVSVGTDSSTGNSTLTGTGTVKLSWYPNFNSFGKFKAITWENTGTIVVNLKTTNGTTIASNISKGTIENQSSELRTLQEIVIELVFTNATLKSLTVTMENKQQERYGAEIGISDVANLQSNLDSKVNISDIKDNLTSSDIDKPLSANQGKVLQDSKVDKVTGKELSSNDFTDAYKEALDSNEWLLTTNQNSTENSRITIYVNPFLRMVDFRYYRTNYTFSSTSEITISSITTVTNTKIGTINVKPITPTPLASYNTTIIGGVLTNGNMTVQTNSTGTKTINVRGMWHY